MFFNRYIIYMSIFGFVFVLMMLIYYIRKEMNEHQKKIESMLSIDEITEGDSSTVFRMKVRDAIKKNPPKTYTIALLNIINFKLINSNYGFNEGDKTLKYIHDKIKENLKEDEFLCRSDIDNFFICIRENDEDDIKRRLKEIGNSINDFNKDREIKYNLQSAVGFLVVDDVELDVRVMMNYTRFSCSEYKKTGKIANYTELVEKITKENKLNSMFEDSLKNKDFKVYLQPKININEEKCKGAEALVRWIHPVEGFISPGEFIEMFEKNGNIVELDLYVFEEVCKMVNSWSEEHKDLIPISVNLSRVHLKNNNFLNDFIEIKKKYNVKDDLIEFELLESSVEISNEKIDRLNSIIEQIHKNGFLCALDDFGFGYSSLAFLGNLNIDTIKLDRRFFMDFNNERARNVIEGFIKICNKLEIKIVAEGIETNEQLDYLKKINCELVQGFIFSKAIDMESFKEKYLS